MVVTRGKGVRGKGRLFKKKKEKNVSCQGLEGGGHGKLVFNGYRVSILQEQKSCVWMVSTVAQQNECT